MSFKNISQFPDGNSFVYYHLQLDRLIIANSNGIIKLLNLKDMDSQPVSIDCLSNLTSVSIYGDKLALTTTEGKLEIIDLIKHESLGDKYRSELALRDSAYINSGNRILCGGDDDKLIVIDLQGEKEKEKEKEEKEKEKDPNSNSFVKIVNLPDQVVNIAYDQAGELSSVSLSNGSVQIYSVFNEELNLNHTLENVISRKINTSMDEVDYMEEHRDELYTTKTQWSSNGNFLLVPGVNNEVQVYERENWTKCKSFKSDGRIVDFKLYGNNLVILTLNDFIIYDFESGKVLHSDDFEFKYDGLPLNIEWHNKTDLLIGSTHGDVLLLKSVIPDNESHRKRAASLFIDDLEESDGDDFLGDNQREIDNLIKENEKREKNGFKRQHEDDEDLDEEDEENERERERERERENENEKNEDDDEGIDVDDSILDNDTNYRTNGLFRGHYKKHKSATPSEFHSRTTIVPHSKIVPYSPGSTPFVNKGDLVDRRYLTMNNIGYAWIVINKEPGASNSITVSFFDRSLNSEYHFSEYQNFDLASMNHKSILLGDSSKGLIYYKSHNDAGSNDSWERQLPLLKDEYLTSICITNLKSNSNTIVVGTNLGNLRFFNQFGVCLNMMRIDPVAALASATSSFNIFMVNQVSTDVYSYSIIDIAQDYKFIQQDCTLPLREGNNRPLIKGLFFNDYNDPCLVGGADDTLLVLQSWRQPGNAKWIPILNCTNAITEYGSNDNKKNWSCWPLGLMNDSLNCLILKNCQFPGFPLPLPVEIDVEIPIKLKQEEDGCEEEFLRAITMGKLLNDTLSNKVDEDADEDEMVDEDKMMEKLNQYAVMFDKSLLKLFAEACKEQKLNKAFSIAKLIKSDDALSAAAKISERMEYLALASKIAQLRERLVDIESD
ncbi:mcl1 [Candida oxycetoniae]|uniref:Mcl1 n=1 Tax=Candida oxycetoniae TaxID=497107 RepID=A0AAI9SX32_9ASCO|nr:mcl1 [Candida oxycetoniae]KAI3404354.2 mcl1 [Candida oxycetoniae]